LEVSRERLDMATLRELAPSADLEPFLQGRNCKGRPSAWGFADALGLPAYQWLSPVLAENDTQSFLRRGGRRVGRKKPEEKTKLPEPIALATPGGDISARQALEIVRPHASFLDTSWILLALSGHAHAEIDHANLSAPRSDWGFHYLNTKTGERVYAQLFVWESAAKITFRSAGRESLADLAQCPKPALPENWLDSARIAQIVMQLDPPKEVSKPNFKILSLWAKPKAIWQVGLGSYRISWIIDIDALSGDVLREAVGWCDEGDYIVKQRRERLRGAAWRDI
jgi:hypothetical protein